MSQLLIQSIIQGIIKGIIIVIFGSLIGFIITLVIKNDLPDECKNWNKFYLMEISLFLSGFCMHIFLEFFRIF